MKKQVIVIGMTLMLLAVGLSGCITSTDDKNEPPEISIYANPTFGYVPLSVDFSCIVNSGNISSYNWDFGDGTTSSERNPVHVFQNIETYTVVLTVTDNNGGSSTDKIIIKASFAEPETINNDAEFVPWVTDCVTELVSCKTEVLVNWELSNWDLVEFYSDKEKNLSEQYLAEIVIFDLSLDYDLLRDEFKDHLEDTATACHYMLSASRATDIDTKVMWYDQAVVYTDKATVHMNACIEILKSKGLN